MAEYCRKCLLRYMGVSAEAYPEWCCERYNGICEGCGFEYLIEKGVV